jgi:predicted DNA-binding ribbon-helix-helix protein
VACFASRLIHVNAATQHICLLWVIVVRMTPVEPAVKKRSVVVGRRKTSTSLENEFWEALREIAQSRKMPLSALLATIKTEHQQNNLSSAIRVFILNHYRKQ